MDTKQNQNIPSWADYKLGGLNNQGNEIETIFIRCKEYIIYATKPDGVLGFEVIESQCPNFNIVASLLKPISSQAKELLSKRKYKYFRSVLVADLTLAFNTKEKLNAEEMLIESKQFLNNRIHDINHFRYVASAMSLTLLFLIPPLLYLYIAGTKDDIYHILNGSFFGSLGAFVSILQRYNSIIIPKYSTWRFTFVRALSRIMLGSIFGGLFIIINKSGFILNIVNSSIFLVYTFSFVSGFSERFFPDMLEKTVNQLNAKEKSETNK